jgi:hypothetical protein
MAAGEKMRQLVEAKLLHSKKSFSRHCDDPSGLVVLVCGSVGITLGEADCCNTGLWLGPKLGFSDWGSVGFELMAMLGKAEDELSGAEGAVVVRSVRVGTHVGVSLELALGTTDPPRVGFSLDVKLGRTECTSDGLGVGASVGTEVGIAEAAAVG